LGDLAQERGEPLVVALGAVAGPVVGQAVRFGLLAREVIERRREDSPLAIVLEAKAVAAWERCAVLAQAQERLGGRVAGHDGGAVRSDAAVEAERLDAGRDGGDVALVRIAVPQLEVWQPAKGWLAHVRFRPRGGGG